MLQSRIKSLASVLADTGQKIGYRILNIGHGALDYGDGRLYVEHWTSGVGHEIVDG